MKMTLSIPYADGEKNFQLNERNILYMQKLPPTSEGKEEDRIREALQNPVGSDRIGDLVGRGDKVAILVDDWTRPTPAYKIVPIVIEELINSSIKACDIRIVFACGTHSKLSRLQMEEKVGRDLLKAYHAQNHDPTGGLLSLGRSKRGTPVFINRFVMKADFKVAIGGICAHPIAGYGVEQR